MKLRFSWKASLGDNIFISLRGFGKCEKRGGKKNIGRAKHLPAKDLTIVIVRVVSISFAGGGLVKKREPTYRKGPTAGPRRTNTLSEA